MAKGQAKTPYQGYDWANGTVITKNKIQNIDTATADFSTEVAEARTRTNDSALAGSLKERLDNMIIASNSQSSATNETMLWVDTNVQQYTIPVQDDFDNLILMQDMQPDTTTYPQKANKIWVKNTEEQVEIPTTEELEQLQDTIASEYSTSKTYHVGDYVYYNGQLYKCINNITVAGAWNANYWDEVVLGNEVSELNSDLNDNFGLIKINNFINKKYINTNVDEGTVVSLSELSSNGYSYAIVPCMPDDNIMITGTGGNVPRLYAFLTAEYKLIIKSTAALAATKLIVQAPNNSAYCIINSETSSLGACYITPNYQNIKNSIITNNFKIGAKEILPEEDFDNYIIPGNYYITTRANAISINNCPVNLAGRLIVINLNSVSNIFQIYIATDGKIFTRERDSNGWSAWYYSFEALKLKYENTNIISTGADLNNYIESGNYYVPTTAIAKSLLNSPVNLGGRLIVMSLCSPNSIFQTYISVNGEIFTRKKNLKYWSYWENISQDKDTTIFAAKGAYNILKNLISNSEYNLSFGNAFMPIPLTNYLGNNQNVHPKVLYLENGFGNHTFWMAYTPYPYSDDIYENPCIAYSDDGYSWKNIDGNPLDEPINNGYNSDAHLVYRDDLNILECWYRYFNRDTEEKIIYRQTTTDGLNWSEKEIITTFDASHDCASPAIIWDGNNYLIWGVNGGTTIQFFTAAETAINTWNLIRSYNTVYTDNGITVYPWHLDVIKENNNYIMLVMCRNSRQVSDGKWSLFITTSNDNIDYITPIKVLEGADNWDKFLYRSSIIKVNNKYRIYYSACNTKSATSIYNNARWGIGITESDNLTSGYIGRFN